MAVHVVFVCEGNICRSPMAEAVFEHLVAEAGLEDQITVDSCGTSSWHAGESAHPSTIRVLRKHGIMYGHRSRPITRRDLADADYLIAMDSDNLYGIRRQGETDAEVALLLDYAPEIGARHVPDPYYQGGFESVYELVEAGCRGLLAHIRRQEGM